MNAQNSRLTKSQREISRENFNSIEKCDLDCQLILPKDTARGRSRKVNVDPIVETNLKAGDVNSLSIEMGKEIATLVIDQIVSLQNPQGANANRSADNFNIRFS